MKESKRLIYFDNLRAILMLSIVVLHVACIFSVNEYWRVLRSSQNSYLADFLYQFSQSFAVPTFFIISGYFAFNSLIKYSKKEFLKKRFIRIGIPLVFIALTLNTIQEYILIEFNYIDNFNLKEYIIEGKWKHHLWFLINLLLYFVFIVIFKKNIIKANKNFNKLTKYPLVLLLFLAPMITVVLLAVAKIYPIRGIFNSSVILMFLTFFLFGVMLKNNEKFLNKIVSIPFLVSILIITISIIFEQKFSGIYSGKLWQGLNIYIIFLGKWFATMATLKFVYIYLNRDYKILNYFKEASYSIYLTHHLFVIAFGVLLIKYNIGYSFGIILLLILTYSTTIILYNYAIAKSKILYFLFNGTTKEN